nr:serine protease [Theileria orientalis]
MSVFILKSWKSTQKLFETSFRGTNVFIQRKFKSSFLYSSDIRSFHNTRKFSSILEVYRPYLQSKRWNFAKKQFITARFNHTLKESGNVNLKNVNKVRNEEGLEDNNYSLEYLNDLVGSNTLGDKNAPSFADSFSSIMKLYCDSTDPNYSQPWQMRKQIKSIGSAFAIKDRLILTNAHCVSWQNRCLVRKHGSTDKKLARVVAVGHECDLAVLTVDDEEFWNDVYPLEFGETPYLHDSVTVLGYPTGGDNLCITSGVVSRVDVTTYSHSNSRLLCVQIDAAINPGNSGGPALKAGKVVGVAFQACDEAQNIGFIVPSVVVKQFLHQVIQFKRYSGFVNLGITYQVLTNPDLKSYLTKESKILDLNGILVCQRDNSLKGKIEPNDVIMKINGHKIADDGTVHFRGSERVHLAYSLTNKFCGEECELTVLRDNKVEEIKINLNKPNYLVPEHQWDVMPRYYIYGGLVFVPLSMEYLKDEFGKKFYERAPTSLLKPISDIFAEEAGQEVVVLSQILASDLTIGYDFKNIRLTSINDLKVLNLSHLEHVLLNETKSKRFIRFEFEQGIVIVLETKKVPDYEAQILHQHAISSHKSREL